MSEYVQVLEQCFTRATDFYTDLYSGAIDTETGFTTIVSEKTAFVWNHAQATMGSPTCYIFPCPTSDSEPSHSLIPHGSAREPGLILLTREGLGRFWDSIGIGLAGGEGYGTFALPLDASEGVSNFIRGDVCGPISQ